MGEYVIRSKVYLSIPNPVRNSGDNRGQFVRNAPYKAPYKLRWPKIIFHTKKIRKIEKIKRASQDGGVCYSFEGLPEHSKSGEKLGGQQGSVCTKCSIQGSVQIEVAKNYFSYQKNPKNRKN